MDHFFKVTHLPDVLAYRSQFCRAGIESVALDAVCGRILAADLVADLDLPGFSRATMDGYAVAAASTFGASEANPAYLALKGRVSMGEKPAFGVGPGEAAGIATGGMLPQGTDAVAMVEHTELLDPTTIEVYRSVAPGQHVIAAGEDYALGNIVLTSGSRIRPQEAGLLAAFGQNTIRVFQKPRVGIVSTGDEIVPVEQIPARGRIRDINTHTLSGQVLAAGGVPVAYGIVSDDFDDLRAVCRQALDETDMVLISGGSSVGIRDFTVRVLDSLPQSRILVQGISISPGKPTILADTGGKAVWGLPGHVVSAMVVFSVVVQPFLETMAGLSEAGGKRLHVPARLSRNVPSAQGRIDFIRVRLSQTGGKLMAEPLLGKSGLINTMVQADGLIAVDINTEGLDCGEAVSVMVI
ncbi:MAG: molybdopterin molybdenumtransferase MoeA [Desulfobacterales bacterium]|nr:molybdopterin molybdenumtransferase MoeA [Desulfobacterales bacterium]